MKKIKELCENKIELFCGFIETIKNLYLLSQRYIISKAFNELL
jgi:hypothetical protein